MIEVLHDVTKIFLEIFSFWLFLLFRCFLEKYVQCKICSSDIALSKKKLIGFHVGNRD